MVDRHTHISFVLHRIQGYNHIGDIVVSNKDVRSIIVNVVAACAMEDLEA